MMQEGHIREASVAELRVIQDIAYKTWPVTYGTILSKAQLDYMLELFYSLDALHQNVKEGHKYLIAFCKNSPVAFASFYHNFKDEAATRIPKIYVLPEAQGKSIGRKLIQKIESEAKKNNSTKLSLNVNRLNEAKEFYSRLGFLVVQQIDIPLDHGYLMEDYIMEKIIN